MGVAWPDIPPAPLQFLGKSQTKFNTTDFCLISAMPKDRPNGWSVAATLISLATALSAAPADTGALAVSVLSSRPDMVSGGDALVEIRVPQSMADRKLSVTLDRRDVTKVF